MRHLLFLIATFASCQAFEFEYVSNGTAEVAAKWDITSPIPWVIDHRVDQATSDFYRQAMRRCTASWFAASAGHISFTEEAHETGGREIVIYVGQTPAPQEIGYTEYYTGNNAVIFRCYVILNNATTFSADVQAVTVANPSYSTIAGPFLIDDILTHELGHCIGLGHPSAQSLPDLPPANLDNPTMWPILSYPGQASMLHVDDIQGIRSLYGLTEPVDTTLEVSMTQSGPRARPTYSFMASEISLPGYWTYSNPSASKKEPPILASFSLTVVVKYKKGRKYVVTVTSRGRVGKYVLDLRSAAQKKRNP